VRFPDGHDHHEPDKMLFLSGFIFWRNSYGLILISFKRSKVIVHITAQEYPAQQHCHHYIPHIIRRQQLMGGNAGCGGYRFDRKFGICNTKHQLKTIQKIEHNLAYMDYAMIFCL
jgi:hypothetical protein